MTSTRLLTCTALAVIMTMNPDARAGGEPDRVAVVVGSNQAIAGRRSLRYAHKDARNMAAVLRELCGFDRENVHVVMDPDPDDLLELLENQAQRLESRGGESLLLFYYSGHADDHALYPNGKPLELSDLKTWLERPGIRVRIGMIDACRGGGWTGTKGLSPTEVFDVEMPLKLSSEGSALIASSSGFEDAHESEDLQGSFFTHYWIAGLRGAADNNQDHQVSLGEVFQYAKSFTVRDTAVRGKQPQHPSFQYNLRGRQDLSLSRMEAGKSQILLEQAMGPLQLVHLESGLILLEIPSGERKLMLAVPPGTYVVRRIGEDGTLAHEFKVEAGMRVDVREGQLVLLGSNQTIRKSAGSRPAAFSTLGKGDWSIEAFAGSPYHDGLLTGFRVSRQGPALAFGIRAAYGITDRLQLLFPGALLAYRGGEAGEFEWIPWGGLAGVRASWQDAADYAVDPPIEDPSDYRTDVKIVGEIGAGFDLRWWFGPRRSLLASLALRSILSHSAVGPGYHHYLDNLRIIGIIGYSHVLTDFISLHLSIGAGENLFRDGVFTPEESLAAYHRFRMFIGSPTYGGIHPHPLFRLHFTESFKLDVNSVVSFPLYGPVIEAAAELGVTWIF